VGSERTVEALMAFKDIVAIASSVVAMLATFVGGVWAYYRFRKGRSSEPRLTLGLDARVQRTGSENCVLCTFEVKNVGLTKVDIARAHVRICLISKQGQRTRLATRKILAAHSWVEPAATVHEEHLVSCADQCGTAQVEFRLVAKRSTFRAMRVVELPSAVETVTRQMNAGLST